MKELFTELKRRKVFRVAVVYVATAFVILQAADIMLPNLGVPGWAMSLVVALLVLGFPLALVLTWALELTPDGVRVTPARMRPDPSEPAPSLLGKRTIAAAGILVVLGIGLGAGWFLRPITTPNTPAGESAAADSAEETLDPRISIAVLPFADLSPEGDQEYISDGIAEEILNALRRVDGLTVASRTSSFRFKGERTSIPLIAEELGVAHVLEGSVRKSGDRIRVTGQLIPADTDSHLWSDTYDRELTTENLFAIQEDIANAIVAALRHAMGLQSGSVSVQPITDDLNAYELYLKARQSTGYVGPDLVSEQIRLLEAAVGQSPEFAEAWAMLASNYTDLPAWNSREYPDSVWQPRALAAVDRAIALDGGSFESYMARAIVRGNVLDWAGSDQDFARARALAPNDSEYSYRRGIVELQKGYIARAAELLAMATDREPGSSRALAFYGMALAADGHFDQAEPVLTRAVELGYTGAIEPLLMEIYRRTGRALEYRLLHALFHRGDPAGSRAPLSPHITRVRLSADHDRAQEMERFRRIAAELGYPQETLLRNLGRSDATFLGEFESAQREEPALLLAWWWGPDLEHVRPSAEFKAKLRRSGLVDYWRENGWPDKCRPVGAEDFQCH